LQPDLYKTISVAIEILDQQSEKAIPDLMKRNLQILVSKEKLCLQMTPYLMWTQLSE
jgi:hypothetical protein